MSRSTAVNFLAKTAGTLAVLAIVVGAPVVGGGVALADDSGTTQTPPPPPPAEPDGHGWID